MVQPHGAAFITEHMLADGAARTATTIITITTLAPPPDAGAVRSTWNNGSGTAYGARGGSASWGGGSGSATGFRGSTASWGGGSGSATGFRGGTASWGGGSGSYHGAFGRSGSWGGFHGGFRR